MKLIDISHHQGTVNFEEVKNAGYEGVIIKAGGSDAGFYQDSRFEEYYQGAKSVGLHIGSYYYVGKYCLSEQDGIEDAIRFADILEGKQFDLPVYMDVEAPAEGQKNAVTDAIEGFCNELENRGYYVGVYASDISGFKDRIDYNRIKDKYDIWVARYGSKPKYVTNYQVWQYSESGTVAGINDNQVDLDECYVDYPTVIINGGFNGYSNPPQPQPTPEPQPQPTLNYKVGDRVNVSSYYASSTDPIEKAVIKNATGTITKVLDNGCHNPYLLDNGDIGWCNDGDIRGYADDDNYYPQCNQNEKSLVDGLKSIGVDSSFINRKNIANCNGIHNYIGTSTQNSSLLAKLKAGKLKRP